MKAKYHSDFAIFMQIRKKIINMENPELKEIALSADVHPTTLYGWRDGKVAEPRLGTLTKVSKLFGYEITWTKIEVKSKLRAVR